MINEDDLEKWINAEWKRMEHPQPRVEELFAKAALWGAVLDRFLEQIPELRAPYAQVRMQVAETLERSNPIPKKVRDS